MSLCTIYCFVNKINNKKYIGSTIVKPNIRYNQHIYNSKHKDNNKYDYPLYQAIRKYGENNFNFEILEQKECEEQEIRLLEKEYIIKLNTLSPNGYNQTLNTEHPINDVESYYKMSETKRIKSKKIAEVTKNFQVIKIYRSISDCADEIGIPVNSIGNCCRGYRRSTNNRYFVFYKDNGELDIPKYQVNQYKGEKGTTQIQNSSKKVAKIDLNTNKIIETYPTVALAARENNCDASSISKACRGYRKTCGNFKWKYIDN